MEGQTAETAPVIECKQGNEKIDKLESPIYLLFGGDIFQECSKLLDVNRGLRKLVNPFGRSNISLVWRGHPARNLASFTLHRTLPIYFTHHMFALNSVFNNPYNLQDPQHFAKYSRKISGLLNCTDFFFYPCVSTYLP